MLALGAGTVRVVDGVSYVFLGSGYLLRKAWIDIYEWFAGGKAPKEWMDRFRKTKPVGISNVKRAEEYNSKLV